MLFDGSLFGEVIYEQSFTGEDLFNDPDVSYPTRNPQLTGTSLQFLSGSVDKEQLLVVPLVTSNSPHVTISITANLTRLAPTDHAPGFAVSDGTNLLLFQAADNNGGSGVVATGTDLGNLWSASGTFVFSNAGFPAIGNTFDVETQFTLSPTESVVSGSFLSGSTSTPVSTLLDYGTELNFLFLGENFPEQYQINTLSIRVEAVPEPSTLAMWFLVGLTGLGLVGRRGLKA